MTAAAAAPAPARPVPTLGDLAATMVQLTHVLDRESELVRGPATPELASLQEEKARLTHSYAQAIAALRACSSPLAASLPGVAAEMKSAAQRLAGALERNARVLRAMTEATDRVVAAMVGAIKEQRGGSIGYARPRAFDGHARIAAGVTLDRRL